MRAIIAGLVVIVFCGCRSPAPSKENSAGVASESQASDANHQRPSQAVRDAQEIYRSLQPEDAATPALFVPGDRAKQISGTYEETDLQAILKLIGRVRYVYASKRVSLIAFSGNSVTVKTSHNLYKLLKNQTGEWRIVEAYWWEL